MSLGNTISLPVDEEEVTNLFTERSVELTAEQLKELHAAYGGSAGNSQRGHSGGGGKCLYE